MFQLQPAKSAGRRRARKTGERATIFPMDDKYSNFDQLRAGEAAGAWVTVVKQRHTPIAIIAPHGGAIEPGTSEIARAIAGDELSLYLFEGRKASHNRDLHITSANFDEPLGVELVHGCQVAVAIHGHNEPLHPIAYLGGRDDALADAIGRSLRAAGFDVRTDADPGLQGTSPANICNRGQTGRGVQLELTHALREQLFANLRRKGRGQPTHRFAALVAAIRAALPA